MKIKKGDEVAVIIGKDKKKVGKVIEVFEKNNRVTVENVNVVSKHKKPKSAQDKGGIVKKAAPIDASNVMIICPACGKGTRIAHKEIEGKKVRICKKCGASLDKDMAKSVKKEAKTVKIAKEKEEQNSEVKAKEVKSKETTKTAEKKTVKTTAKKTAKKEV